MALLLFCGLILGCGSDRQSAARRAHDKHLSELRRGLGGEPGSLDPAAAIDTFSFEVLGDLYEGLTSELPNGTVVPGAASSWTVDAAGLKYTFTMRRGAKWSNGQAVKAQDFVNAWRRVVDPHTGSAVADNLRLLVGAQAIREGRAPPATLGVAAPTDQELIVNLVTPAPFFPQLLTHPSTFPVYSSAAATSHESKTWVSNGPYTLVTWAPGDVLRLAKNAQYGDQAKVRIDQVVYVPVSDENAELLRYRAGQLDITASVPPSALPMIRATIPNELHVVPYLGTSYYEFNLRRGPFRDNRELRQALTMAIDRKGQLAAVLQFGQQPAFGFVPPGVWNYQPQHWNWQTLSDADRRSEARRHYAQAGYFVQKPLKIRLLYNTSVNIKQIAIAIAAMWKEVLGVDTDLVSEEYRVFLESRKDASRWDVVRLGWTADYNDAGNFLDTLRSDSPNNDAGYQSGIYDQLMNDATHAADANTRKALLEKGESVMLADYPVIPLYVFSAKRLFKPYITGAVVNPLNRLHSIDLSVAPH